MSDITRRQVIEECIAGKITKVKGAKLLNISRQRMTELCKDQLKREAKKAAAVPPPPASSPFMDVRRDPAPPAAPNVAPVQDKGAVPPAAEPSSMADVMKGADAGSAGGPGAGSVVGSGGTTTPPPPPAPTADLSKVDPEDIDAGRELLKLLNINVSAWAAKLVYGIKEDDPRMEEFKQPNGFLKVALKRNGDKAAPVGKLSKGWKGIVIGYIAEVVKIVATFGMPEAEVKPEAGKVVVFKKVPDSPDVARAKSEAEEELAREKLEKQLEKSAPEVVRALKPAPEVQTPAPAANVAIPSAPSSAHTNPFGEASDTPIGPRRTLQQKIDDEKRARGLR